MNAGNRQVAGHVTSQSILIWLWVSLNPADSGHHQRECMCTSLVCGEKLICLVMFAVTCRFCRVIWCHRVPSFIKQPLWGWAGRRCGTFKLSKTHFYETAKSQTIQWLELPTDSDCLHHVIRFYLSLSLSPSSLQSSRFLVSVPLFHCWTDEPAVFVLALITQS